VEYWCLSCGHHWKSRGLSRSRVCSSCWGRVIVDQDEIRLSWEIAVLFCEFAVGNTIKNPIVALPLKLATYLNVMSRARTQADRRNVTRLMLKEAGYEEMKVNSLADKLHP